MKFQIRYLLRQFTPPKITVALHSVPTDLTEAYMKYYDKSTEWEAWEKTLLLQILSWLLRTDRPLHTYGRTGHAISVDQDIIEEYPALRLTYS